MLSCRKCELVSDVFIGTCPPSAGVRVAYAGLAESFDISGIAYHAGVTPGIIIGFCLICCICILQSRYGCFYFFPGGRSCVVTVNHVFQIFWQQLNFCCCCLSVCCCSCYCYIAVWISFKAYAVQIPGNCCLCTANGYSFRQYRCSVDRIGIYFVRCSVCCHNSLILCFCDTDRCAVSCS